MLTAKLFRKSSADDKASKADGSKPSTTVLASASTDPALPTPPQAERLNTLLLLMSPLITVFMLTYFQTVTPLSTLPIHTWHHHPPHFILPARYYESTIPETITAMQPAVVHLSLNVLRFEVSNRIWSGPHRACIFDRFQETLIPRNDSFITFTYAKKRPLIS